jgi:hypothetical protein
MAESEKRRRHEAELKHKSKQKIPHKVVSPFLLFASRSLFFFLTAAFGLPAAAVLWGQDAEYQEYRIENDGRFVQILRWEEQENVFYYEVEIEKQAGALWEGYISERTEGVFLEVSLIPGTYRYRVRPYDFLGKPRPAAGWIQFEVLPAKQPELLRFSPEAFYLDEDLAWSMDLFGRNFADGIEIFLQGSQGNLIKPDTVIVEPPGDRIHLVFSHAQPDPGFYTIHVTNPGGLADNLGIFRILLRGPIDTGIPEEQSPIDTGIPEEQRPMDAGILEEQRPMDAGIPEERRAMDISIPAERRPMDISISAGYRPMVSLYGRINELFETDFFPIGVYARFGIIPFKKTWGNIGFELEPSWNYFLINQENYKIRFHMPGGMLNGVYQHWFSNRTMTLNFRIGGGIYSALDYRFIINNRETEPMTILIPAAAAGASFQWFIRKPFFVEAGLDFTHFFTVDDPQPAYLRPFAGAGWQF